MESDGLRIVAPEIFGIILKKRGFVIDEIRLASQFDVLREDWEKLLEGNGRVSPFLTHDWFRCCSESYKKGRELCILTVRDGSDLLGVAPLWRYHDTIRGIQVRTIAFITTPDTPFADFIISEMRREEILIAILHYLYTNIGRSWDVLSLNQWPTESPNREVLQTILQGQGKRCLISTSSMMPYIHIQGEWDTFLQTLSTRFRKTHRNIINRIGKLNRVEIQCYDEDRNSSLFNEVVAISEKSWKQKEGIAIGSKKEFRHFFSMLTNLAVQKNWLMVWLLKVDAVPIAMEYDLKYGKIVYALRADFDEAYKEYSPGSYLEYQIVKHLFEAGYKEYNTGPGMNTYKLHWTDKIKENMGFRICNDNFKGRIIWVLETKLIPFAKKVRDLRKRIH